MSSDKESKDDAQSGSTDLDEFEEQSLVAEFVTFLGENKKWWLLPIVISIALLGALAFLSSTGAAPFIYTLF